jgi:ELWxxDGT repeat protein
MRSPWGAAAFFYAYNNKMYFLAGNQYGYAAMWVSDGTNAGTTPILSDTNTDVYPFSGDAVTNYANLLFAPLGNNLIFGGDDGVHGYELWITDGTSAGTRMVKDINPNGSSYCQIFTAYNGKVYFMATDDTTPDYQLWATDGTAGGTVKITNNNAIFSNPLGSTPSMIAFDSSLYFNANYDTSGNILYRFTAPANSADIESPAQEADFNIWPNPATDKVDITLRGFDDTSVEIDLFDATGKLVGQITTVAVEISTFDISHFADGVYFIRIVENNHFIAGVRKFIKS